MASEPTVPAPIPSAWTAIGPAVIRRGQAATSPPMSGRIAGIAVSRHGDVMYVGTANGGARGVLAEVFAAARRVAAAQRGQTRFQQLLDHRLGAHRGLRFIEEAPM